MLENIILTATIDDVNKRADVFVAQNTDYTRNFVQSLLETSKISVNGKEISKSYKMKNSDILTIKVDMPESTDIKAQNIPLDIYFEDEDILIVNKPKGMVVHPANGNESDTLVNALLFHCEGKLSSINGDTRPGIVHRIDKDTSGLLIIAKNNFAHENLAKQFETHEITRTYNAIVYGNVKQDAGVINAPIGRHHTNRKKFCVTDTNSKSAVTHYKVLEKLNAFTLIEAKLETGRTHQIRVHMQSIGHPVAGDTVYGPKKVLTEINGQALHAATIGIMHPRTNEYIEFTSPWCDEFTKFYNKVKLK